MHLHPTLCTPLSVLQLSATSPNTTHTSLSVGDQTDRGLQQCKKHHTEDGHTAETHPGMAGGKQGSLHRTRG